jgi:hypothetical protein
LSGLASASRPRNYLFDDGLLEKTASKAAPMSTIVLAADIAKHCMKLDR